MSDPNALATRDANAPEAMPKLDLRGCEMSEEAAKRVIAYLGQVRERLRQVERQRAEAAGQARQQRKRFRQSLVFVGLVLAAAAFCAWQVWAQRQAVQRTNDRLEQAEKANEVLASIFYGLPPAGEQKEQPGLAQPLGRNVERAAMQMDAMRIEEPMTKARLQTALGSAFVSVGRARQAIPLLSEAQKTYESQLGPLNPRALQSVNTLSAAYQAAGQMDQALPRWEQMLAKMKDQFGSDHPNTWAAQSNLTQAYQAAGQLDKALPLLEQTLARLRDHPGVDNPDTQAAMNNLAWIYWRLGKLDRSVPLFEETLKKRKSKPGPDHMDTLQSMANLGVNYRDAGRLPEGIAQLEDAWQRLRQKAGAVRLQQAWIPSQLAVAYERAGQFAKAESLYRELLEQTRLAFGDDTPRIAAALEPLGANLLQQKRFAEAESTLRECLTLRDPKQADDWRTWHTRSLLGEALLGQKKYAEAESLLLQGYEGMSQREGKIPPQDKVRLTEALERLVRLYEATDSKDKADRWRKKLEEARKAKPPAA